VKSKPIAAGIAAAMFSLAAPVSHADIQATLLAVGGYQVGTRGAVSVGAVVSARTNLYGLWAKASYRLECDDYRIRPALTGSRSWTDFRIGGPVSLVVTAPEWAPTELGLPGWENVMTGTFVTCIFTYSGEAKTSLVPLTAGGASFPLGGDSWEATQSLPIGLVKVGSFPGEGCIF
jgi:hypothetical protein